MSDDALILLTWIAFFPLKCFCFQLTIDSQEVAKLCQREVCVSILISNLQSKNWKFSPMATSYINIIHYENQEIDISVIQLSRLQTLLQFHQFLYAIIFKFWRVFVYNSVYRFMYPLHSGHKTAVITKEFPCALPA